MPTRRRTTVPTRLAKAYTWQPATQEQRTVRQRRLPFSGDPRDLIQRAAELVAPLRPWRAEMTCLPGRYRLSLNFGADAHDVSTHVSVTLHAADAWLFAYFARDRSVAGLLYVDLSDDGDGEDLTVPVVSVDELARMPATIGAAGVPHTVGSH
jgi:hypothetical protein